MKKLMMAVALSACCGMAGTNDFWAAAAATTQTVTIVQAKVVRTVVDVMPDGKVSVCLVKNQLDDQGNVIRIENIRLTHSNVVERLAYSATVKTMRQFRNLFLVLSGEAQP